MSGSHIHILRTYEETEHDGLSLVFSMVSQLGEVVDDTQHLTGQKVFVAGIPFLYTDKLSTANTNIIYTTFESSELPHYWVDAINDYYHCCIVPHLAIKQKFLASGVRIPVEVVHQSYKRLPWSQSWHGPSDVFRVGFLGVPVKRKNLRRLYEACRQLRTTIPNLELFVHVARSYDWLDLDEFSDIASDDFVAWTSGVLSNQALADWYRGLSCYVYPSSAEGWSFTPRESVYLGVPTALSSIPTHQELIASGYCTVIHAPETEVAEYEAGEYGRWHKVEVSQIVSAITEIYENKQLTHEKARAGASWIENKWPQQDMMASLRQIIQSDRASSH